MQKDISISGNTVYGTSNYVTNFTELNESDPAEQQGNYLALYFKDATEGKTVKVKLTKEATLTDDGIFIGLIKSNTQTITVTIDNGEPQVLKLSGLTLKQK